MTNIKIGGVYRISGSPYSFDGSPCTVIRLVDGSTDLYKVSIKKYPRVTWACYTEWLKPFNAVKYL